MTTVEIEYCKPCGFLDRAIETQSQILESCGDALESVGLVPGDGGVFKVSVDNEVAFDVEDAEYDLTAIMNGVCDRLPECDCDPGELTDEESDSNGCSPGCC